MSSGGAGRCRLRLGEFDLEAERGATRSSGPVMLAIRPERVRVEPFDSSGPNRVPAMVERLVFLGSATQIILRLAPGATLQALVQNDGAPVAFSQGTPVQAHLPADALRVLAGSGTEVPAEEPLSVIATAPPARPVATVSRS